MVWYAELRIGILLKVCRFVIRHITQTDTETETELLRRHQKRQIEIFVYYRPQRSCGKVMFLHMSVILSTGGGGCTDPTGICSCTFSVYSLKTCCLQAVRKIFRESQISHLEIPKTLQEELVNKEIINSSLWDEYDTET